MRRKRIKWRYKKLTTAFICAILALTYLVSGQLFTKKDEVSLARCIDGDTARFMIKGEEVKTRFLAIDAPESTNKIEAWGEEASDYACELLTKAERIELESDPASDEYDKYDRLLAWIFVDGSLLQEEVVKEGLAEVAYLYGDYKYTDELLKAQDEAMQAKRGIWSDSAD